MIPVKEIDRLRKLPLRELAALALEQKLAARGTRISLCSIINAKSGKCSEDCRFCTQSAHYHTDAPVYPLKDREEVVAAAGAAKKAGASRFSLVTSGRGISRAEVEPIAELVAAIRAEVGIEVCASLGIMDAGGLTLLKEAGMSRYHHNLETSREFFPQVVATHTFEDRVKTIEACHAAGVEVCAGGIFGLGESEEDRISMALSLRELEVDSVPLNILIPLPGTPLAGMAPIPAAAVLRSIALYRLINPAVPIRLAGGRETILTDLLGSAFMAGADGMMIGGYLTQRGRAPEDDRRFVAEIQQIWTS
ncbi:MAG: biotin synthase BioB [Desulfurivibrionaceae bacterium]|nr:biotin synthase BioB [Desulfobulbales bacterium]MDT8335210.1 biotin synthase BioB [Desulfurivibrionaceae bacterium]